VGDKTIIPPLPFYIVSQLEFESRSIIGFQLTVKTEPYKRNQTNRKRRHNMLIMPRINSTSPIKSKKHQCHTNDEQKGSNRITGPDDVLQRHFGKLGLLFRVVKDEQAKRSYSQHPSLHPENSSPTSSIGIRCSSRTETPNSGKYRQPLIYSSGRKNSQSTHSTTKEGETICQRSMLEGEHL